MSKVATAVADFRRRLVARAREFAADDAGATAIEYGLIVALIFLAIIGAVKGYVNSTSAMYSKISSAMDG